MWAGSDVAGIKTTARREVVPGAVHCECVVRVLCRCVLHCECVVRGSAGCGAVVFCTVSVVRGSAGCCAVVFCTVSVVRGSAGYCAVVLCECVVQVMPLCCVLYEYAISLVPICAASHFPLEGWNGLVVDCFRPFFLKVKNRATCLWSTESKNGSQGTELAPVLSQWWR